MTISRFLLRHCTRDLEFISFSKASKSGASHSFKSMTVAMVKNWTSADVHSFDKVNLFTRKQIYFMFNKNKNSFTWNHVEKIWNERYRSTFIAATYVRKHEPALFNKKKLLWVMQRKKNVSFKLWLCENRNWWIFAIKLQAHKIFTQHIGKKITRHIDRCEKN